MNKLTMESLEDTVEYFLGSEPRKVNYNEARNLRKHTYTNRVAGHDDYGIVQEPCVVHLEEHESVAMWLWQEGSDWEGEGLDEHTLPSMVGYVKPRELVEILDEAESYVDTNERKNLT